MRPWAKEKVKTLKLLLRNKGLTATQIGILMGTTKNAITGKCMRMGIRIREGKPGPVEKLQMSPLVPPSVAYVRCLEKYRTNKFRMVRP